MKTNPEAVLKLIEQANTMIRTLMREPPCRKLYGNKTCIENETDVDDANAHKRKDGRRRGWNGYRQEKMCSPCAALWAVSVARNHLDAQLTLELSVEAEKAQRERQVTP